MSAGRAGEGDADAAALRVLPAAPRVRPHGDRAELEGLLARLQQGVVSGQDAAELLERMRRVLGVTATALSQEWTYDPWSQIAGDLGDWPLVYGQIAESDPSRPLLLAAPFGTCYVAHPHHRYDIYGALEDCGLGDALLLRIPSLRRRQLLVAMFRERGAPRFGDDDLGVLGLVYPHLVEGLRTLTALRAFDRPAGESRAEFLAGDEPCAVITVPSGTVEWSPAARAFWTARTGPQTRARWQALERALLRATTLPGRCHRLPTGAVVDLAPLPDAAPGSARMLALFHAPPEWLELDRGPTSAVEECLSPRERQVARWFAAGHSTTEIAEQLGIRPHTARVQLRNVYDKLGVSSRAELIQLFTPI